MGEDEGRSIGNPFLTRWGQPPGTAYSSEREAWVREKVLRFGNIKPQRRMRLLVADLDAKRRRAELEERDYELRLAFKVAGLP